VNLDIVFLNRLGGVIKTLAIHFLKLKKPRHHSGVSRQTEDLRVCKASAGGSLGREPPRRCDRLRFWIAKLMPPRSIVVEILTVTRLTVALTEDVPSFDEGHTDTYFLFKLIHF